MLPVQASWLPEEYKSGSIFRAAARYKGAPIKLQQQLAHGSGGDNVMYLSRGMGLGSSVSTMQWEVRPLSLAVTHVACMEMSVHQPPACALRAAVLEWNCVLQCFCFSRHAEFTADIFGKACGCGNMQTIQYPYELFGIQLAANFV